MYTFYFDVRRAVPHGVFPVFMFFYVYVWALWLLKVFGAARYRPYEDVLGVTETLSTTVILPVYNEPEAVFRRVLASVRENDPTETIVVVDGGDSVLMAVAEEYVDRVIAIPKSGKRAAIQAGTAVASDSDVFLVLDSDTVWTSGMLRELLKPFADPRVGGVTPKQRILQPGLNSVRRLADWIEDLRYSMTAPAQSVFGQIGCLAGRTIAYRREAFVPAVEKLANQKVCGLPMAVGDDRVLSNEILRYGWRTVYQRTALVLTDAPNTWRLFWRQQLRWGRSSQRETLLSLRWLWRKPVAAVIFVTDMITPFLVFALASISICDAVRDRVSYLPHLPLELALLVALAAMTLSLGIRQIPHFRREPQDIRWLPLFVLQLTFFMVPMRLVAFATMFHNSWGTRDADVGDRSIAAAYGLPELHAPPLTVSEGAEPLIVRTSSSVG